MKFLCQMHQKLQPEQTDTDTHTDTMKTLPPAYPGEIINSTSLVYGETTIVN